MPNSDRTTSMVNSIIDRLRPELKVGRKKNHGKEVTVRLKFRDFVRAGDRQGILKDISHITNTYTRKYTKAQTCIHTVLSRSNELRREMGNNSLFQELVKSTIEKLPIDFAQVLPNGSSLVCNLLNMPGTPEQREAREAAVPPHFASV